jgi:hypothetical protein
MDRPEERVVDEQQPGPVDRFLDAVASATIATCDAWSPDVVLDATVPNWRFHRTGVDEIRETYAEWFADPGRFEELQRAPVEGGEVVRYLLAWTEGGVPHTAHHVHVLEVDGDVVVADTVVCGGRWPAGLMAEMEAADAR